jgi:heme oxygenase (biliverdin-IX-beta and delta-forming)
MTAAIGAPLLAALRTATADLHALLDRTVQSTQPFASMAAYAVFLSRHMDARSEIVRIHGGLGPPGPWQPRAEAVQLALHHDLQQLGDRSPEPRPSRGIAPPAGLGLLYVMEGSLVGGRIQARRVTGRLGSAAPITFLSAGASARHRWPEALQMISSGQEPHDEALNAARDVFRIYLKIFASAP